LNIIVCIKQILDPEVPPAKFQLSPTSLEVQPPEGIPPIMNPFDAQALELALKLKESHGGKITVLTVGNNRVEKVVKYALSMGADEGFVLSDMAFKDSDSFITSHILVKAIQKVKDYDLILCGQQSADWDEGLTGSLIAYTLDLPMVTLSKAIEVQNGGLLVTRVMLNGYQQFSVPMPALITVSNEAPRPRLPSGKGIIFAARKQIPVWNANDISASPSILGKPNRKLMSLAIPKRERKCVFVSADNPAEAGAKLTAILKEKGTIKSD